MKILLVDVDSKIPNIALCKISSFHKNRKDNISILKLHYDGYPSKKKMTHIDGSEYDKIYISCVFTVNNGFFLVHNNNNVEIGGSGTDDPIKRLPKEIDDMDMDYSIYPDNDTSYGFITRGCIRKCSFCFVPKMEGDLHLYSSIERIVKHRKVSFLDNNILAYEKHIEVLNELIEKNIKCEFNQGLDIRLLNDENAELLSKLNYIGEYIFAFDDIKYEKIITEKLNLARKYIPKPWRIKFFVYHNEETMTLQETLYRIRWCKERRCLPYLMRDKNCWNSKNNNFLIDLAAYCNQPSLFKKLRFDEFIVKRHTNNLRRQKSIELYTEIGEKI